MQIKIDLKIFLFIILFFLTKQINIYSWIMLFAVIHELGHLLFGIILGFTPISLRIMPLGISIIFENHKVKENIEMKKVLIALAGPFTNLTISIITALLPISNDITQLVMYSNILIAIFNLLIIYPLDGGRILKGLILRKHNRIMAEEMSNRINNIVIIILTIITSILVLYIQNIAIIFIMLYLWSIVISENRKSRIRINTYKTILKFQNDIEK